MPLAFRGFRRTDRGCCARGRLPYRAPNVEAGCSHPTRSSGEYGSEHQSAIVEDAPNAVSWGAPKRPRPHFRADKVDLDARDPQAGGFRDEVPRAETTGTLRRGLPGDGIAEVSVPAVRSTAAGLLHVGVGQTELFIPAAVQASCRGWSVSTFLTSVAGPSGAPSTGEAPRQVLGRRRQTDAPQPQPRPRPRP
jgi:hypothetical protein